MRGRKVVVGMLAVLALMGLGVSFAVAQDAGGGGGRGGRGGRGNFDPAQMQERYMNWIKENIKAGDEEWAILQPRLQKVMTLSRETRGGNMRGMMGGRRGRPGANAADNAPVQPQSATQKAQQALQETLENEAATAEEIKAKLTALRAAREKAKQELAVAQQALRELLTQRQEARFVLMGFLD